MYQKKELNECCIVIVIIVFKINETLFNINEMKMTSLKISSDLIYPFFSVKVCFFF